jgi:hypothetical protein
MANTTSGTYVFDKNFSIDEVIEEAYERIGVQPVAGNQLRMARRTLNIMFQEWEIEVFIIGKLVIHLLL